MKPHSPVLPLHPELPEQVFAKDQPEYMPLPACFIHYQDGNKTVMTRWRMTWRERITVFLRGCVWIEQMTQGEPLQPQRPSVYYPLPVLPKTAQG